MSNVGAPVSIGDSAVVAVANFTPSVVSYTAGNIIDTAKEFVFTYGDGTPIRPGSLIRVLTSEIKIAASGLISGEAIYTGQFYSVTPPSARADNAAWARASGDLSAYRGSLPLGTPVAAGGTCYIKTQFTDQQDFRVGAQSLFAELVNSGTFTGAAVARAIVLYGIVI